MKRTGFMYVALLAAVGALVAAASGGAAESKPIKAAWIYVGPHNDGGWSQAHDDGRLYVQKKLGRKVVTTYKENVPEGPQTSQVIDSLVRDGNKIIFATSFGFMDAMAAAAKKYPDVYFEHATGFKTGKNFANYFGAAEDAIYLSGMAAGAATKNGKVGYIVPFPIPEIIRHLNGFALGVQAVRPDATIRIVWTKSWFDPAKERKAAESLVAAGVDVIGQNVDSPSAGQYAQSKGIPWVGHGSNAQKFATDLVADRGDVRLGPLLPEAGQAGPERHLEDGKLLGLDGRRLRSPRAVRPQGLGEDESRDQREEEGAHLRHVLRVHGAALRPEGQAPSPEGQADDPSRDPRRGLARPWRDRFPQGLARASLTASAPG